MAFKKATDVPRKPATKPPRVPNPVPKAPVKPVAPPKPTKRPGVIREKVDRLKEAQKATERRRRR